MSIEENISFKAAASGMAAISPQNQGLEDLQSLEDSRVRFW